MEDHFKKLSEKLKKEKKISILEIGCNDGVFLQNFKTNRHLGVEPSKNVYNLSKKKSSTSIIHFLTLTILRK